jgi:hypothetical protein
MAHARRGNASWMSSRISQRMRSRRNQCNCEDRRVPPQGPGLIVKIAGVPSQVVV